MGSAIAMILSPARDALVKCAMLRRNDTRIPVSVWWRKTLKCSDSNTSIPFEPGTGDIWAVRAWMLYSLRLRDGMATVPCSETYPWRVPAKTSASLLVILQRCEVKSLLKMRPPALLIMRSE